MSGLLKSILDASASGLHVQAGPLLRRMQALRATSLEEYIGAGGLRNLRSVVDGGREAAIAQLDQANVRGRAGGGFPAALKWWLLAQSQSATRHFICNANAAQPGGRKESYLLRLNPHFVLEALLTACWLSRATRALLCMPEGLEAEAQALRNAAEELEPAGVLEEIGTGGRQIALGIETVPSSYILGEETALLEALEGRAAQPRKKPPLPVSRGLFGEPTAVSNLETVLQAGLALAEGVQKYRQTGAEGAPGTLVFSLCGDVKRPGLYELPLGVTLRELVYRYGGGLAGDREFKMAFPGGVCSTPVTRAQLDLRLDFDSLVDAGTELGSGVVIVVGEGVSAVEIAREMAAFYFEASCGKCMPCKDGTRRVMLMLERLADIDRKSVDWGEKTLVPSKRSTGLVILSNTPAGISYTDAAQGIDKITHLAEFFKHRGDCRHSAEAANAIQGILHEFREEFEAERAALAQAAH
jgi:NADH-quinone oxidoreductase subunit F